MLPSFTPIDDSVLNFLEVQPIEIASSGEQYMLDMGRLSVRRIPEQPLFVIGFDPSYDALGWSIPDFDGVVGVVDVNNQSYVDLLNEHDNTAVASLGIPGVHQKTRIFPGNQLVNAMRTQFVDQMMQVGYRTSTAQKVARDLDLETKPEFARTKLVDYLNAA